MKTRLLLLGLLLAAATPAQSQYQYPGDPLPESSVTLFATFMQENNVWCPFYDCLHNGIDVAAETGDPVYLPGVSGSLYRVVDVNDDGPTSGETVWACVFVSGTQRTAQSSRSLSSQPPALGRITHSRLRALISARAGSF